MDWRDDDVVEVFGHTRGRGMFLSGVRDEATGAWLQYRSERHPELEQLDAELGREREHRTVFAVLDTGLVHRHPAFEGRIMAEVDFTGEGLEDESGHGTVVALMLLQDLERSGGASLVNIKVADGAGHGAPAALLRGLEWLTAFAVEHREHTIVANLSAGVYRRRRFGLLACDGTCDICTAAAAVAEAGVSLVVAAGNTAGKTACPATIGVKRPEIGIIATTLVGGPELGIGTIAVTTEQLPTAEPMPGPSNTVLTGLRGEEAEQYLLQLGEHLLAAKDFLQAEKAYAHLMTSDNEAARGEARIRLAEIAAATGRANEVAGHLEPVLELGDGRLAPFAANWLAELRLQADDLSAAAPYLDIAVTSTDPELAAHALYNRGRMRRQLGRRDEAYADLHEVAVGGTATEAEAQLSLGSLLAEEGEIQQALRWLQAATMSADQETAAFAELGIADIAAQLNEPETAADFYQRAVARPAPKVSAMATEHLAALRRPSGP